LIIDNILLDSFLEALQENIPGFYEQPGDKQRHLANLIWEHDSKYLQHKKYSGYMSIHYKTLDEMFGRGGFRPLNKKLKIFDVTEHWLEGEYTKGYKLTDTVARIKTDYLNSDNKKLNRLIRSNGTYMKKAPRAIASLGKDKRIVNKWNNEDFDSMVPINIEKLETLKQNSQALLNDYDKKLLGNDRLALLLSYYHPADNIHRCINVISQILKLAHNDIKKGSVMHLYKQCGTGRLFADGTNIQSAPREVKQAALCGLWEYDFKNCHYAIFKQMANNVGIECPTIDNYLQYTEALRECLAFDLDMSIDEAKKCLLAILYGANSFEWHKAKIPKLIGPERAKALIKHPHYSAIQKEILQGRKAILKQWDVKREKYKNAMGIPIQQQRKNKKGKMTKTPPKEILAHLIQGIEVKMLNAVYHEYPKELKLLQHDGFASKSKLDKDAIEQLLKDKTGFDMDVKEWHIRTEVGEYKAIEKFFQGKPRKRRQ